MNAKALTVESTQLALRARVAPAIPVPPEVVAAQRSAARRWGPGKTAPQLRSVADLPAFAVRAPASVPETCASAWQQLL